MDISMSVALPSTTADDAPPELNPHLDRARLARTFAGSGRVQIANVLTDASAQRVHHALEKETSWGLILNDGKKVLEFETVSAADYQAMAIAAWGRARSGFQYFYNHYRLYENRKVYAGSDHYLARLAAFLIAPEFIGLMRAVTGIDTLCCISSTATLYRPLDFLTIHDDGLAGGKLIAFVLNMTPNWRPDWGGALQFYDTADHVEEAYLPTFNALNLFLVPKLHSVTQVSAFGGLRYSVSGWLGVEESDRAAVAG
jgi:Rps23 Pro-64 3,4-dihydroxylase Tpa1-like proline 4-hydroxylase